MTTLYFDSQSVTTADAVHIATLLRKGWKVRPDPPEHDSETESVRWDGTQWLIEPKQLEPIVVTPLQARIALAQTGLLEAIENAVAALAPTDPTRLAWEYASQFDESSPVLISMCDALGITAIQRRQMFLAASQIRV